MRSPEARAAIAQHRKDLGEILGKDASGIGDPFKGKPNEAAAATEEKTGKQHKVGTIKWSIN
jgi:hypothetical protein